MIKSLTDEQRAALERYRDCGIKRALRKDCDPKLAKQANREFYAACKLPEPLCLHLNNPIDQMWLLSAISCRSVHQSVAESVDESVYQSVDQSVADSVRDSVRKSVRASVRKSVHQSVAKSVDRSVRDSVAQSVRESVRQSVAQSVDESVAKSVAQSVNRSVDESVGQSVYESVRESVRQSNEMKFFYYHHCAGWAGYSAWIRFYIEQLGIAEVGRPYLTADDSGAFWFVGVDGIALSCDPPTMRFDPLEIKESNRHIFHADGKPALEWPREYARWWYLHGIRVPQWIAETPAGELDAKQIAGIKDVDVRREFIRKIGIERVLDHLNARTIDSDGDYSLLKLQVVENMDRTYLKMLNPSIGVWHLEAVDPSCETVQAAINWRAVEVLTDGHNWRPDQLT